VEWGRDIRPISGKSVMTIVTTISSYCAEPLGEPILNVCQNRYRLHGLKRIIELNRLIRQRTKLRFDTLAVTGWLQGGYRVVTGWLHIEQKHLRKKYLQLLIREMIHDHALS